MISKYAKCQTCGQEWMAHPYSNVDHEEKIVEICNNFIPPEDEVPKEIKLMHVEKGAPYSFDEPFEDVCDCSCHNMNMVESVVGCTGCWEKHKEKKVSSEDEISSKQLKIKDLREDRRLFDAYKWGYNDGSKREESNFKEYLIKNRMVKRKKEFCFCMGDPIWRDICFECQEWKKEKKGCYYYMICYKCEKKFLKVTWGLCPSCSSQSHFVPSEDFPPKATKKEIKANDEYIKKMGLEKKGCGMKFDFDSHSFKICRQGDLCPSCSPQSQFIPSEDVEKYDVVYADLTKEEIHVRVDGCQLDNHDKCLEKKVSSEDETKRGTQVGYASKEKKGCGKRINGDFPFICGKLCPSCSNQSSVTTDTPEDMAIRNENDTPKSSGNQSPPTNLASEEEKPEDFSTKDFSSGNFNSTLSEKLFTEPNGERYAYANEIQKAVRELKEVIYQKWKKGELHINKYYWFLEEIERIFGKELS